MTGEDRDIDEIIRDGGEFWVIEVENSDGTGTWRPWVRGANRDQIREAFIFEKNRRPNFRWRIRKITVTATVLDW